MDDRRREIAGFLNRAGWSGAGLTALAGDASGRRYFRVRSGAARAVLMDAAGDALQSVRPFLRVGAFLRDAGLNAPEVFEADEAAGLVLMEDFGDGLFARRIVEAPEIEAALYMAATDVLIALDRLPVPEFAPEFGAARMARDVAPAYAFYRGDMRGFDALQDELETVLRPHCAAGPTFLLRDFHAENLIWLPEREGLARVGLLDFQDAMAGAAGIDLASMLMDARRDLGPGVAAAAVARFAAATGRDADELGVALAAIGAQRNLRILGVFSRLALVAGQPRYLAYLPRVWGHVRACLSHPSLAGLARIVDRDLPPPEASPVWELRERCAPTRP